MLLKRRNRNIIFVDVRTLRRILHVLIAEEEQDETDSDDAHEDHVVRRRFPEQDVVVLVVQIRIEFRDTRKFRASGWRVATATPFL